MTTGNNPNITDKPSGLAVGFTDLVRPTRCWFCQQPMYYAGNPKHELEVRVEVYDNHTLLTEFHSHVHCWSAAITPNDQVEPPARLGGGGTTCGISDSGNHPVAMLYATELAANLGQLKRERDDMLAFVREQVELWDNDGDSGFPLYEQGKQILARYYSPNDQAHL